MTSIFNKDTLLDLSVNIIPLGILAFFLLAFTVFNPWGGVPTLARALQYSIVGVTFLALVYLTYVAALRIEGSDEEELGGASH